VTDAPFVIAQISDTHFGTVDPLAREALLADLAAAAPEVIVLSGDVTQRARRCQFAEARAFLDALPAASHCLAIPGNHDIALFDVWSRIFRPYALFQRYVSAELEPRFANPYAMIQCADATRRWRHKHGTLNPAQIERIAGKLRTARTQFRIVVTHQPLVARVTSDIHNVSRGADIALERWIRADADLFIGGHIHLPYCVATATRDGSRRSVVLQAGTSLSTRIRAGIPNSYNLIRLFGHGSKRRMELERRDLRRESRCFDTHFVYRVACGPQGWELAP
jgi:3',5'-cyclic AMP phosphodiesterase CpdA